MQKLPRDEAGPVFAEPWQAQAFAIAVRLSAQGYFTWKEWADALASELATAAGLGEADDGSEYYQHWLAALERLIISKGLADIAALFERKEAWADAYRHTPHGQPVQLRPGFRINYSYRQSPLHTVTYNLAHAYFPGSVRGRKAWRARFEPGRSPGIAAIVAALEAFARQEKIRLFTYEEHPPHMTARFLAY